ncbi:MAG: ArsS family sensor histidine kinase [bacterium]
MRINRHSILFKINITFILSFTILLFFYLFAHKIVNHIETFRFIRRTIFLVKKNKLADSRFSEIGLIKNKKIIKKILKNGKLIFKRTPPDINYTLTLLKFNGSEYVYLKSKTNKVYFLVKRNTGIDIQEILLAAWLSLNLILAFLYISIYRSIHPLSKFRNKMEEFKKGDINIDLDEYIQRKDEIGYIAKEFKEAMNNVKKTLNTRVWFIRNVAHELKTPITKGKIALELLKNEDEDKKRIFSNIFTRLEMLINELFATEKIVISDTMLNLAPCNFADVINRAEELLFIGDGNSKINIISDEDYIVKADFELLSIAIKNLLDNAIKFSIDKIDKKDNINKKDKKVIINIEKGVLSFINAGQKPSISEEFMFEPFLKDLSLKNKDGFGLGLYITKQILEKHGLIITYKYKDNKNIFSIDLNKIIYSKSN